MRYEIIEHNNFYEVIKNGISVVYFWAQWCIPCKTFSPIFNDVSDFDPSLNWIKINSDTQKDIVSDFNIKAIPSICIVKDGVIVNSIKGIMSKKGLESFIENSISDNGY